jgi:hypothetical protein
MLRHTLLATALFLTACPEEEIVCTEEARASVQLTVSDSDGQPVMGATATFTPEGGAETDCDALTEGAVSFVCGYEVEGLITIKVVAPGFESFEEKVEVAADECHVITEDLAVELTASGS